MTMQHEWPARCLAACGAAPAGAAPGPHSSPPPLNPLLVHCCLPHTTHGKLPGLMPGGVCPRWTTRGGHSCASEATIQRSLKRRHLLGRLLQSWRLSKHSRLQVCGVVRAPAHFTSPSTHLVTFWEACTQGERVKEAGPTITPCWDAQVRAIGAGGTIKARGNVCRPRERAGGMWKRRAQGSAIANCSCEPLGRPTERRMNPL